MFNREEKLKNCPFCDGTPEFCESMDKDEKGWYFIRCRNCGIEQRDFQERKLAILDWNRRWMDYDHGYQAGLNKGFYDGLMDVMGTLAHQYNLTALQEGLITRVSIKIEKEPKE